MEYPRLEEEIYTGGFSFDLLFASQPTPTSPNKRFYIDNENHVYLYQANCLELMDEILKKYPEGCFDMIFADPPYFLSNGGITCQNGKMVSVNKGDWDVSRGPELNHQFNTEWLSRCQKLLKQNGTIWVSGTQHVIHSVGFAMQQLDMKILNDITWEKPNPPPNLTCRYFTHSTETIIWAAKNQKSRHMFNYQAMKSENNDKQMKSVWRIAPPKFEEKKFGKHPTQKPMELIERCILASTNKGDFVFDPFNGSGTTAIAAMRHCRRYVGADLNSEYLDLSVLRVKNELEDW